MNVPSSTDAIRKNVIVCCTADIAFRTWTERINSWWPKGHSRSGDPETTVLMESRVGGRIFERTPEGVEHDWGKVTAWDPPRHFAYHWYLGSGPHQPTLVNVHFTAQENGSTRVDLSHQGPELIGELWSRNNSIYDTAWENVLPAYVAACDNVDKQFTEGGE